MMDDDRDPDAFSLPSPQARGRSYRRASAVGSATSCCTGYVARGLDWLDMLCTNYGKTFILMCVFGEHFIKGLLLAGGSGGLVNAVMMYTFKALRVPAARFTALQGVAFAPWSAKPLLGFINDSVPIFGYGKRYYVVVVAVLATAGYLTVGLLGRTAPEPEDDEALTASSNATNSSAAEGNATQTALLGDSNGALLTAELATVCFICATLQAAWTDLMIEGAYTVKMRARPKHASDLLSWVWGGINVFGVVGYVMAGPMISSLGPYDTLLFAVPFAAAIVPPALRNWLHEPPPAQASPPCVQVLTQKLQERKKYFLLSLLLGACALTTTLLSLTLSEGAVFAFNIVVVIVCGFAAFYCLPFWIAGAMTYMFIAHALSLSIGGAVFYFYTDDKHVCPTCPHFSPVFFNTWVGVVDSLCASVGVMLFNTVMRHWSYRRALLVTQVIVVLANLVDVVQFNRWISPDPIPDAVLMLGKTAFQTTTMMMNFLPTTILISRLCPKNIETVVYALLAGYANFGSSVAAYCGAYVVTLLGMDDIDGTGTDDFSPLWKASLLASMLPLVSMALIPVLVPPDSMDSPLEHLLPQEHEETRHTELATRGSDDGAAHDGLDSVVI